MITTHHGGIMENFEYRILDGTRGECQKILNQWRHEYIVKIFSMCTSWDKFKDETQVTILLTRERNGL